MENKSKTIDEDLKEKFKKWNGPNIQNDQMNNKNNDIIHQLFQRKILNCKQAIIIDFENTKFNYLNLLKFGLENKIEAYIINDASKYLTAKVFFDHINGGRVGLVHGGCLYFALLLCISCFIDHCLLEEVITKYKMLNITTTYKKKVRVDNFLIINVSISNQGLSSVNKNTNKSKSESEREIEIIAEMIDYEEKVTTRVKCSFKLLSQLNKF